MDNKVLVLNVRNEKINDLFDKLREYYHDLIPRFPHITIRGPQKRFSKSTISKVEKITQNISIEISGLDVLESNDVYFCVFKIEAPSLREVWHKPDFPIKEFGFNPHITLCKGDEKIVRTVQKFIIEDSNIDFNNLIIDSSDIEIKKVGARKQKSF